jgi:DNA invertase Pin-like site-specific DNA recombinase
LKDFCGAQGQEVYAEYIDRAPGSLTEGFDTSTPLGRLLLNLLASLAEFELEVLRGRVYASMERSRRQGKRIARPLVMERPEIRRLWPTVAGRVRSGELSLCGAAHVLHIGKSTVRRLLGDAPVENAVPVPTPVDTDRHGA